METEAQDIYSFSDSNKHIVFNKVIRELRCSVCQNQSLADSSVPFAIDLKREIFKQIAEDSSEQQVLQFVVERYGEFVLYQPPLQGGILWLYLSPVLMLAGGILFLRKYYFSPK
jgi:cytochrome c-type biogenesis protein CcmH